MSLVSGIKHATTGTGTKITNTVWSENHDYDASVAHQNEPLKFVWKDGSERAYSASINANTGWVDLDLTATTSANAKIALVQLKIDTNTVGGGTECYMAVRKNDTTPSYHPLLFVNKIAFAGIVSSATLVTPIGMDSGQVIERSIVVGAGWTIDVTIDVLGYWE